MVATPDEASQSPNGMNAGLFQHSSMLIASEMQKNNSSVLARIYQLASQISVITERNEVVSQFSTQVNNIETRVANLEGMGAVTAALPPVNINNLASEI